MSTTLILGHEAPVATGGHDRYTRELDRDGVRLLISWLEGQTRSSLKDVLFQALDSPQFSPRKYGKQCVMNGRDAEIIGGTRRIQVIVMFTISNAWAAFGTYW